MIICGYVSRLPIGEIDPEARSSLDTIARAAYQTHQSGHHDAALTKIDQIVFSAVGIDKDTQDFIRNFSATVADSI